MVAEHETSAGDKGQEWIARLYQTIQQYESNPAGIDGETFMDLYAKVERAIELSGENESHAFSLDQALFNAVSVSDVDASDLRKVVSHALSIHHRYHADYGRGFEQAYRWCERSRKQQMPDLRFVHGYLLPELMKKGAMGGNPDVCLFLIERLGRFENLEKSPVWDDEDPAGLMRQEPSDIVYQLARRRVKYIAENLTKVPNSLEQRLFKDGSFRQLRSEHEEKSPLLIHQLAHYEYLRRDPFWRRLGAWIANAFRGIVERMAGEYIAYELTKRNGAYIVQSLMVLLILLGLSMGLYAWALKNDGRLKEIETDLAKARQLVSEDRQLLRSDADLLRRQMEEE